MPTISTLLLPLLLSSLAFAKPEPTAKAILRRNNKSDQCPGIFSTHIGEDSCCVGGTEIPEVSSDGNSATACATILGVNDHKYKHKCSSLSSSMSASGTTYRTCMNAGGASSCTADLAAWAAGTTFDAGISVETGRGSSETSDSGAVSGRGAMVFGSSVAGWAMGGLGMGALVLAIAL